MFSSSLVSTRLSQLPCVRYQAATCSSLDCLLACLLATRLEVDSRPAPALSPAVGVKLRSRRV